VVEQVRFCLAVRPLNESQAADRWHLIGWERAGPHRRPGRESFGQVKGTSMRCRQVLHLLAG
jgi:hypothetical protein